MNGHGHVVPSADGSRARCGGPGICIECSREAAGAWRHERERAERAEAERDALHAEIERLRALLQRLIDANPRYNAGERLQLDLEAALAGGHK